MIKRCVCAGTVLAVLALVLGWLPARADGHHLFRPVPRTEMRELSTDRPDLTESPYTVDAGHIQLEMDLFVASEDVLAHRKAHATSVAPVNLKFGLDAATDLQLVFEPYVRESFGPNTGLYTGVGGAPGAGSVTSRGHGPLTLRLKRNLYGNDGGPFAIAMMPFLVTPSAGGDFDRGAWQGGLIVPVARDWKGVGSTGWMVELDLVRDGEDEAPHAEWLLTGTIGRDLVGALGGFMELAALMRAEHFGGATSQLDLGVTYGIGADLQLDAGSRMGLNKAATNSEFFMGFAWRR